ncbi:MAG TPA: 4a-hydroxytetrahydrobiopterin dehydratase [Candidatus Binataceae bacterium]|nr:4a-hydroxytetrahydrobiopterin dehydratase [Candidatus Binataceae bacterium]
MAKLTQNEIAEQLKAVSGWEYADNAIAKLFRFKQFMDGIRFINEVATIAEAADHHPDIHVNYTRVRMVCTTHDAGGVTAKDLLLAGEIERTYTSRPA